MFCSQFEEKGEERILKKLEGKNRSWISWAGPISQAEGWGSCSLREKSVLFLLATCLWPSYFQACVLPTQWPVFNISSCTNEKKKKKNPLNHYTCQLQKDKSEICHSLCRHPTRIKLVFRDRGHLPPKLTE